MNRIALTAALLAVGLVISACAGGNATGTVGRPPLTRLPLDAPSVSPLATAHDATTTPRPLTGQPSLELVHADAKAGPSRAAAEQFALEAAHLLFDVRPGLAGELAVGSIASSTMAASTRAYLIQDMDNQRKMGLERHLDTGLDMWIRSLPDGPTDAPHRVSVELAANIAGAVSFTGGPGGFHAWYRMRLVVVREDNEWRLAAWSGGPSGASSGSDLTAAQRRDFLVGAGWRRIPAS